MWKNKEKQESTTNYVNTSKVSYQNHYDKERQQRNQLFNHNNEGGSDYVSQRGYNRSNKYNNYADEDDNENEDEVQVRGLKQQIRNVKQVSLQSTIQTLEKLHETETIASNTMDTLGQQASQIANINRHLDLSKAYANKAAGSADELKKLNRSIFIPVINNPLNRSDKKLEAKKKEHAEHMTERDRIRQFEYESNARIEEANRMNQNQTRRQFRGRSEADRRRYQFEPDSDDDAMEDQIDMNLNLMSDSLNRIKNGALIINAELDRQNEEINNSLSRTTPLINSLNTTTHTLNRTR